MGMPLSKGSEHRRSADSRAGMVKRIISVWGVLYLRCLCVVQLVNNLSGNKFIWQIVGYMVLS